MGTARITISLDEGTAALLVHVPQKSGYIASAIEARWRVWQDALETLRRAGWTGPQLMAACDVLNGVWLFGHRAGVAISLELADAQRLNGICSKWEVDPESWAERWQALREDTALAEREALALRAVVAEFWAGNNKLEAALERM